MHYLLLFSLLIHCTLELRWTCRQVFILIPGITDILMVCIVLTIFFQVHIKQYKKVVCQVFTLKPEMQPSNVVQIPGAGFTNAL